MNEHELSRRAAHRRVLVLDEHRGSRLVTCCVLERMGHCCASAATVSTALAMIESFAPDVIVYEWKLRLANGIGLAAELRSCVPCDQPVLVVAVSTADEPEGFLQREGVDAYVTKPFRIHEFERVIRAPAGRGGAATR